MARGTTLEALLTLLRVELKASLNPAHNIQTRDTHIKILQRVQEWLWEDYTWPYLEVDRFIRPLAGQRYYDLDSCKKLNLSNALVAAGDVKPDRVTKMWLRDGTTWRPIHPGIAPEHFQLWDSDIGTRAWPVQRWSLSEDEQVELWPIPDLNGNETTLDNMIKLKGVRNLTTFVNDSDRADLDDKLLVLFAAAELMSGEDGQKKLSLANRRLKKLQGNQSVIRRFRMFGGADNQPRRLHGPPTVYYRTDS